MPSRPLVCIVSPALAAANNGNWHTARRWQRFLAGVARVEVVPAWEGTPADVMIALHARRSASSIRRWRDERPRAPLALVLTGTDLYHDLPAGDEDAARSLQVADRLVVLQSEALLRLDLTLRRRTRVILQSAPLRIETRKSQRSFDFVAVGHLRAEKDPLTMMRAVMQIPPGLPIRFIHIGGALDPALGAAAERTARDFPRYRWLGPLEHGRTRRWIARARALVHASVMEGGANVVIEAVRSRVPVLASRMDGNVGLLGQAYGGYFPVGDAGELAKLMQRSACDPGFLDQLELECAALAPRFDPIRERDDVRGLLSELLAPPSPIDRREAG